MNLINWFLFLILLESLLSTLISGMALLPLLDVITMSTVSFLVQLDFGIYWVQNVFNDFECEVNGHLLYLGPYELGFPINIISFL